MIGRISLVLVTAFLPAVLGADIAVATRNIRPGNVLSASDIVVIRGSTKGAFEDASPIVGAEAAVALYAGRAILQGQIAPAASIERNQIVEINFASKGLSMTTEGRALARGAIGQRIRVMNLASKTPIFGTVQEDGTVRVSK